MFGTPCRVGRPWPGYVVPSHVWMCICTCVARPDGDWISAVPTTRGAGAYPPLSVCLSPSHPASLSSHNPNFFFHPQPTLTSFDKSWVSYSHVPTTMQPVPRETPPLFETTASCSWLAEWNSSWDSPPCDRKEGRNAERASAKRNRRWKWEKGANRHLLARCGAKANQERRPEGGELPSLRMLVGRKGGAIRWRLPPSGVPWTCPRAAERGTQ